MEQIPGKPFGLTITDPPYNVEVGKYKETHKRFIQDVGHFNKEAVGYDDLMSPEEYEKFSRRWFEMAMRLSDVLVFTPGNPNIEGFGDKVLVDGEYIRFLENVVYGEEGYDKVLKVNTSKSREKHHAMWPVELCRILIEMGCPPGGKVMDSFGGVGNTAIAAAQLNRDYILIELSEQHCKTAKRRVYKATTDRDFKRKATNLDGLR
jgi:DNA modification methylase